MTGRDGDHWSRAFLERHPVAVFFTLAFAISWTGVFAITLPTGIPGTGDTIDRLYGVVFLPVLAGPLVSALVVSTALGSGTAVRALLRGLLVWRARPIDVAACVFLIPACAFTVLFGLSFISPAFTPGIWDSRLLPIVLALCGGLLIGVVEEVGWTGFAVSRLVRRYALLPLAVGFGIMHGLWHLPVTIWAEGARFGLLFIPYFLAAWLLAIIVMRILIVWVYKRTGNTALAAVAHASHTGWLFVLWPTGTTPWQGVIWTSAFAAVGLVAVLALARVSSRLCPNHAVWASDRSRLAFRPFRRAATPRHPRPCLEHFNWNEDEKRTTTPHQARATCLRRHGRTLERSACFPKHD